MSKLLWIWKYMKGKRKTFVFGLVLSGISSAMFIINPMLAQRLIDDVITPRNPAPLIPLLVIMLIARLTLLGLRYLMIIMLEKSSTDIMTKVRRDMYEKVQRQDCKHYGKPGVERQVRIISDVLASAGEHRAPLGVGRLDAEPDEGEPRRVQNGGGHAQGGLDDDRGHAVRDDVLQDDAQVGTAHRARRLDELHLAEGKHRAAHDTRVVGNG